MIHPPRVLPNSASLQLYGTLEQNKIRDVLPENAQTNKRTSSESFSSRNKAHRALLRDEKLLKKSFVFDVAFSRTTSLPGYHHTKYW